MWRVPMTARAFEHESKITAYAGVFLSVETMIFLTTFCLAAAIWDGQFDWDRLTNEGLSAESSCSLPWVSHGSSVHARVHWVL